MISQSARLRHRNANAAKRQVPPRSSVGRQAGAAVLGAATTLALSLLAATLLSLFIKAAG